MNKVKDDKMEKEIPPEQGQILSQLPCASVAQVIESVPSVCVYILLLFINVITVYVVVATNIILQHKNDWHLQKSSPCWCICVFMLYI